MKQPIPKMAAALVPRELSAWALTAVALGALEGGLLGVIVKNQFEGAGSPAAVNLAVAVVAGAPSFTNLASFLFTQWFNGRDKLLAISRLMVVMGVSLMLMALPGLSTGGLVLFCLLTVVARIAWSGILTLRATVWRANYPRDWRAQIMARLVRLSTVLVAGYAALIGFLLDWHEFLFRPALVVAGICSLVAARVYRNTRLRRHRQLLAAERAARQEGRNRWGLSVFRDVLQADRDFRNYMACMMLFGSGNLMVIPMLVVMLNDRFSLSQFQQVSITSSLPLLVLCLAIPYWGKVLDQRHIFAYRAVHSWFFAASFILLALALSLGETALLWPGSALLGGAYAGAHLGWNLGHNDFSGDANAAQYMSIHVSFTGLRGLVVPLLGISFYQFLQSHWPSYAMLALWLPCLMSIGGSAWFVMLHREYSRRHLSC